MLSGILFFVKNKKKVLTITNIRAILYVETKNKTKGDKQNDLQQKRDFQKGVEHGQEQWYDYFRSPKAFMGKS